MTDGLKGEWIEVKKLADVRGIPTTLLSGTQQFVDAAVELGVRSFFKPKYDRRELTKDLFPDLTSGPKEMPRGVV